MTVGFEWPICREIHTTSSPWLIRIEAKVLRTSRNRSLAPFSRLAALGLGVLAGRPDLRWRARPPELAAELLAVAAERVRPGGTITYSVCTIAKAENEDVVDRSGLTAERPNDDWPEFAHPRGPEFLLTLPHKHGTSGFFIARLRPWGHAECQDTVVRSRTRSTASSRCRLSKSPD